ncbi:MAG: preprotein translocase subunit SecE [Clostridia bacterium]|nr:preprotein translocase subunit SecE [Clostridia bacterium]
MADNMDKNMDKEAMKAAKEAAKAAQKAKEERIKASKPKKEGNVFTRAGNGIAKFFKDFRGVAKKVSWPDTKTVFKNAGIVLAVVIVVGGAVYGIDQILNLAFSGVSDLAVQAGEYFAEVETEVVTDANGEAVTDANGEVVTQVVTTAATEVATDEHGHIADGHTHADEETEAATEEATEEATTEAATTEETATEEVTEETESAAA